MQRFHLTKQQKRQGILQVLYQTPYSMTADQIGRELGFKDGRPLEKALLSLMNRRHIIRKVDTTSQQQAYIYRLVVETAQKLHHGVVLDLS